MKHAFQMMALLSVCAGLATATSVDVQEPAPKANLNERLEATKIVWEKLSHRPIETVSDMDTRALWSYRLAEASIEAGALTRHDALTEHLKRMEVRMDVMKSLKEDGRAGEYEMAFVQFHIAEAKRLLAQASAK
jgi:hypothetical protein